MAKRGEQVEVDSKKIIKLLHLTCQTFSKKRGYRMTKKDLGTSSIRSRAAMSLFLMEHLVKKIMMIGKWSSDAFMVYIRP